MKYRWPLNNMGLNCKDPLNVLIFSMVNTALLCRPRLVESDAEPR